jgi:hypothetical protein
VAGDLIPPPSPAGQPPPDPLMEPMASPQVEAATPLGEEPAPPAPSGPAPFRSRFGFVWGALLGIGACAIATFALLIATQRDGGPKLAANWSEWQPETARMIEGGQEIADHIGLQYKLEGGEQLVSVRSTPFELGGEEIGVAVRPLGGEIQFLDGDGLMFVLNGLGPNGRVPTGTPSKERGRLLMREALELALYSFRYLDDVTMVAVRLPQSKAVFYRPGDLLDELQVPLDRTLSPKTPRPSTMSKAEAARVDSLTLRNLFLASVQQLEADQNYLVLVEPETVR